MSDAADAGRVMTDEEHARALREQLKSLHTFDLVYEMMVSLISFGYQKLGLSGETAELRDLGDAHFAIEALGALLRVTDGEAGDAQTRDLHSTLAQMQLGYVQALELFGGRPAAAAAAEAAAEAFAEASSAGAQVAEEPAPVNEEPAPAAEEPTPAAEEPAPVDEEPAPSAEEPEAAPEEPEAAPEEPVTKKPAVKKAAVKKAATKKPAARRPAAKKPPAEKPPADSAD